MKEIVIYGTKYKCPESWAEVTLKQQIKVSKDTEEIADESLKKLAILSGYANIPLNELKRANLSELPKLYKHIAFINESLPEKPITEFDFNGSHYHCGQNMIDMEFQDYISIENTLQSYSGNTYAALPTILAIMCKKRKETGELESLDEYDVIARAKEFEDLPITIANSLAVFFSTSVNTYKNLFLLYSNPEPMMESKIVELENMLKKQDGQGWLTRCVFGILRYLTKYIRRKYLKHYTSTQQKSSTTK